jgi:hypothetical protein
MKPTPFNPATDLAPIPFDMRHCLVAAELKQAGMPWTPHVGCFVWDRDGHIAASSPFPHRIYFILNLGRFQQIFTSIENVTEKLIWLPTEHQTRLLCARFGVMQKTDTTGEVPLEHRAPGDTLLALYRLLLDTLRAPAPCEGSA